MKKILFFLIILCLCFNSQGQYLPLRVYTSADGLSSNQVRDIVSDNNGALWIACGSGLSYFTGFKFVNFGLKEGLPDLSPIKIEEAKEGITFALTYHGLAYKKSNEDYFKKIPISGEVIDFVLRERNAKHNELSILVCVKDRGLFCYSFKNKKLEAWLLKFQNPYSIEIVKDNVLLSLENGKIYAINIETKKYSLIKKLNSPANLKRNNENSVFAITEKKVLKITHSNKKFEIETLYSSNDKTLVIFDALISRDGKLWIGTNKYLIQISDKGEKTYDTENGLPELPVFSIFENNDGILWIGSNSGLAKLVNNDMIIYKKLENHDIKSCISLYWDDTKNQIWAGINRGVGIIKNQKTYKFNHTYLNQYVVWAIERDDNGNYYFATEGGGLVKLSPSGKTTIYKKENNCLPDNRVTDILYLNNSLYVSTKNGFAVQSNGKWKIYTTKNGLPASYIRNMTKDNKGNVYLSTYGAGIVLYKNNSFVQIIKNMKNEYSTIYSVKYKNGIFWAACNYGLLKVKDGIAKLYNSKYGFPNYSGVAVLPLENYVWFGTDGGLCLFDINKEKVVEILTKDEGLPGNEFTTHNAICKDSKNNIWVGVFGGIARIKHDTLLSKRNLFNPKTILKVVSYRYKKNKWKIHPTLGFIEIPYGAKDITFYFDVIWFRNDYSTAIFYKLKGENEEWKRIYDLKNTKIQFNFLSYGGYTLLLKIMNLADNKQSIEKSIIQIKVKKPWWAKKWVILSLLTGLILLIIGIVFFISHLRTKHLREEKEKLDKMVKEKTIELQEANEQLREKNKLLKYLAEKDFLTGLYNRRHAIKVLKLYQKLADRDPDFKISFIMIDIDFFKNINDSYGHEAGDEILKQLSKILKKNTRKSDIIARWGGEEFLIILPKTNLEQARIVAEKLRKAVERTDFKYNGKPLKITISAGVEELNIGLEHSDEDIEKILNSVDEKLYRAKEKGRNQIV